MDPSEQTEGAGQSVGKAGRNESRKLLATFLNNLGLALFIAGLVQPVLATVTEGRSYLISGLWITFAFLLVSATSLWAAHRVVRRLED